MKKTLCSLVLSSSVLAGGFFIPGCSSEESREQQRIASIERQVAKEKEETEKINRIYNSIRGFGHYSLPQIEITARKSNVSLSLKKHIGNALKAQTITLPVSQEYFDSVKIGQELDCKFNTTGFFLNGVWETYHISVSGKKHQELYCLINGIDNWQEIDSNSYNRLVEKNKEQKRFNQVRHFSQVYINPDEPDLTNLFASTYNVEIESYKSNFTFDLSKHFANACNKMHYTIQVPSFIGSRIKPGSTLDRNFVGASLFFSNSPSEVTFKVKSVSRN